MSLSLGFCIPSRRRANVGWRARLDAADPVVRWTTVRRRTLIKNQAAMRRPDDEDFSQAAGGLLINYVNLGADVLDVLKKVKESE